MRFSKGLKAGDAKRGKFPRQGSDVALVPGEDIPPGAGEDEGEDEAEDRPPVRPPILDERLDLDTEEGRDHAMDRILEAAIQRRASPRDAKDLAAIVAMRERMAADRAKAKGAKSPMSPVHVHITAAGPFANQLPLPGVAEPLAIPTREEVDAEWARVPADVVKVFPS